MENKFEKIWERVDRLRETDKDYDDSVEELAYKQKEFREKLEAKKIPPEHVDEIAEDFSNETLEKMEAQKEKFIDDLTKLKNRRALNEDIPQILSFENRKDRNCAMIMIDFDHFKEINDQFGHLAGDRALKKLSDILRNKIRHSDFLFRYGGDEFIVFLAETDSREAVLLAEKIRKAVEESVISVIDKEGEEHNLKRTVSIGCVGTDQLLEWKNRSKKEIDSKVDKIMEDMIIKADIALCESKETHRNKVVVFRP